MRRPWANGGGGCRAKNKTNKTREMEVRCSFEMLAIFYEPTRRHLDTGTNFKLYILGKYFDKMKDKKSKVSPLQIRLWSRGWVEL